MLPRHEVSFTVPRAWGVVCQHAFVYGPASLGSGVSTRLRLRSRESGEWCVNTPSPTVPRVWGVVCQHAFAYGPASLGSGVSTRLRLERKESGEWCVNTPSP